MTNEEVMSKLSFDILRRQTTSKAKLGLLCVIRSDGSTVKVSTPALLSYTARGSIPHLTPDTVDRIRMKTPHAVNAVNMSIDQFMDMSPPSSSIFEQGLGVYSGFERPRNLRKETDLECPLIVLDTRDPALNANDTIPLVPSEVKTPALPKAPNRLLPNTDAHIHVRAARGTIALQPAKYYQYVESLKPDVFVAMNDEIHPASDPLNGIKLPSRRRLEKAANRNMKWLDEAIAARVGPVFAPIIPEADQIPLHLWFLKMVTERHEYLSGYALDSPTVPDVLELEPTKPFLHMYRDALPTPHEYLQAIAHGVDLHGSGVLKITSDRGYAMTFALGKRTEGRTLGYSLWTVPEKSDLFKPIQEGCDCMACELRKESAPGCIEPLPKFTRAYLNHLLVAHEMLAHVLIQMHNLHTLENFFDDIRSTLQDGTFDSARDAFSKNYDSKWTGLEKVGTWK